MTEWFFSGYGCWFVKHHFSGKLFEVYCSQGFNGNKYLLSPLHDREEGDCKSYIKTTGFFNLTRQDEYSYSHTNNLATVTRLNPSTSDSHTRSTIHEIIDQVQIGSMSVDIEDCYFMIDKDQHFDLITQDSGERPEPEPDTTPSGALIKKRNRVRHNSDTRALLEAALDEMEESAPKTPTAYELANYVLGDNFIHESIKTRVPEDDEVFEKERIKSRELKLKNGSTLNFKKITSCYKRTIFKK
ncbi:MAG: hypothetical protein WAW61_13020 [Methylococcaceae bacterium]